MKKILTITAAAAVMLTGGTSAQAQMAGLKSLDAAVASPSGLVQKTGSKSRRRGAIGAGIAIGIIGAAAAAAAHVHRNDRYYRERRYESRCRSWRRWCRNGDDEACWNYDRRC